MGVRYTGDHPRFTRRDGTGKNGKYVKIFGAGAIRGMDNQSSTGGAEVWIAMDFIEEYFTIKEGSKANFHYLAAYNALRALNNRACNNSAEFSSASTMTRRLNTLGANIQYSVEGSIAYITEIELVTLDFKEDIRKKRAPGLYNAFLIKGNKYWDVGSDEKNIGAALKPGANGEINIGVSGHADNAQVAANIMPLHFHKAGGTTGQSLITNQFNLLYTPDEQGLDSGWHRIMQVSESRAIPAKQMIQNDIGSIMQSMSVTQSRARVNWVVQGEGAEAFTGALSSIKANASLDQHIKQRKVAIKNGKKELMDDMESTRSGGGYNNHYAYFSNPIGGMAGHQEKLERLGMQQLVPGTWHESNDHLMAAGLGNSMAEGKIKGVKAIGSIAAGYASHASNLATFAVGAMAIMSGGLTGLAAAGGLFIVSVSTINLFNSKKSLEHTGKALMGDPRLKRAMAQVTASGDAQVERQLAYIQKMTKDLTRNQMLVSQV